MRLRFAARFLRRVESAIENLYGAVGIRFVAIRSVRSQNCADFFDIARCRWLAFEIPSSKLDAHDFFSFCFGCFLASVEHSIHFLRIRLVVDHVAIDFDPGMSLERHLLRTDN